MLAYLFVALAVVVRFMDHPFTFTPVAAALLFYGARGSRRYLWVPFAALAVSDVLLTKFHYHYPFTWDHYVSWVLYAVNLLLVATVRENAKPLRRAGGALASSGSLCLRSSVAGYARRDMY